MYTCDTSNKKTSKQGLIEAIKFLFMLMKKRDINPIGPLVIDYIKEHASSLYEYLLKKKSHPAGSLESEKILLDKNQCNDIKSYE